MADRGGNDVDTEGLQIVSVTRVSRFNDGNPLTRIKQREESEHTATGRPGGDDDALGWDRHSVSGGVPGGDGFSKLWNACRARVPKWIGPKVRLYRFDGA
jgi:hypothetical protein